MLLPSCFTDLRQLPDNSQTFQTGSSGGLFPKPFNVATKAEITANATCGDEVEEFCRMADIYSPRFGISVTPLASNWQLIKLILIPQTTVAVRALRRKRSWAESSNNERNRRNSLLVAESHTGCWGTVWVRHDRYWFEAGEPNSSSVTNVVVEMRGIEIQTVLNFQW